MHGLASRSQTIEVVVARGRRVSDPPGVRTRVSGDFDRVAQPHLGPPRVLLEHAVLIAASRAGGPDGAMAVVADACQSRRTVPARLAEELARLPRLRGRGLLAEVLADVTSGAMSALERRYLRDVERAHRLPAGTRQRRVVSEQRISFRDLEYAAQRVVVELDGRLGHEWSADRARDLSRDLRARLSGG